MVFPWFSHGFRWFPSPKKAIPSRRAQADALCKEASEEEKQETEACNAALGLSEGPKGLATAQAVKQMPTTKILSTASRASHGCTKLLRLPQEQ